MKIRSIIFDADSIFAIWGGHKTQMRLLDKDMPPVSAGDVLYVRETWTSVYDEKTENASGYAYYAGMGVRAKRYQWHSPVCMPREAARLFLHITDVTFEPLQRMTVSDCVRDGGFDRDAVEMFGIEMMYRSLWNRRVKNAPPRSVPKKEKLNLYGWEANPWVWVLNFRLCERPEGFL